MDKKNLVVMNALGITICIISTILGIVVNPYISWGFFFFFFGLVYLFLTKGLLKLIPLGASLKANYKKVKKQPVLSQADVNETWPIHLTLKSKYTLVRSIGLFILFLGILLFLIGL